MCNCGDKHCNGKCLDPPLQAGHGWPGPHGADKDDCGTLSDIVASFNRRNPNNCNLKAEATGVINEPGGTYTVTLKVTGNSEPVEVSLNRKNYQESLVVTGVRGDAVAIYVRQRFAKRCETAVYVVLNKTANCVPPDAPQLNIVNNECDGSVTGRIALKNTPANVRTYWYTTPNATGAASTTPPAYRNDTVINGSVRFVRIDDPNCVSAITPFQTTPAMCGCVVTTFGGTELPAASVGLYYNRTIPLLGTAPFSIGTMVKPVWMQAQVQGSSLILSGTPVLADISVRKTVEITILNCGVKSAKFVSSLSVLASCAQVEASLTYVDSHYRPCSSDPFWRVADQVCFDDTKPAGGLCRSYSPSYRVSETRCVNGDVVCSDKSSRFRVSETRCSDGTQGTPTNPCVGVISSWRVFDTKCTGTPANTPIPVKPCLGVTSIYRVQETRCKPV